MTYKEPSCDDNPEGGKVNSLVPKIIVARNHVIYCDISWLILRVGKWEEGTDSDFYELRYSIEDFQIFPVDDIFIDLRR